MSRREELRKSSQKTAENVSPPRGQGCVRKRYLAPRLKIYGRLAELTRFGGSQMVDSGFGLGNQP